MTNSSPIPPDPHADDTLDAPASDPSASTAISPQASNDRTGDTSAKSSLPVIGRFFGDYEILQELGQGGMGAVYKARHKNTNRIVALKMILGGKSASRSDVDRFYAEAESTARLRHPNIVKVYDVGMIGGRHFISMDYIEGQDLSSLVGGRPLAPRHAALLVKKICKAIQYAHEHGVIHRDLKPSNVLINASGEPIITDFGVAIRIDLGSYPAKSGTIVGTPSYMPPEQARGADVGPSSDVYSIGALLYELLTASPPFGAQTTYETMKQVLEAEPLPLRQRVPSVPRDLEIICLKCLRKDPKCRYASAAEVAAELDRYLEGKEISTSSTECLEKRSSGGRRRY